MIWYTNYFCVEWQIGEKYDKNKGRQIIITTHSGVRDSILAGL